MEKVTGFWQRFVQFITFVNLPIRQKFLLFELGTFFWFMLIGSVAVASLSFIHYRYSQITQTTLPYMKVVFTIQPELSSLERMLANKEVDSNFLLLKGPITQMKNRLAESLMSSQKSNNNGNIFEMIIHSLSKDDTESIRALQAISNEINAMEETILSLQKKRGNVTTADTDKMKEFLTLHVETTQEMTQELSNRINGLYQGYSQQVADAIRLSINTTAVVILVAIVLLMLFTRWLREAFSKPIESMIHQIHSIGTGEVDLSKKLKIKSKDEIGTLSQEFNKLVDTVYGVTVFKKVIEEDSSLEVVYTRLGEVFEKEAGIHNYRIFDVNPAKQTMSVVYPHITDEKEFWSATKRSSITALFVVPKKQGIKSHRLSTKVCVESLFTMETNDMCVFRLSLQVMRALLCSLCLTKKMPNTLTKRYLKRRVTSSIHSL